MTHLSPIEIVARLTIERLCQTSRSGRIPEVSDFQIEISEDGSQLSLGHEPRPESRFLLDEKVISDLLANKPYRSALQQLWEEEWMPRPQMSDARGDRIEPTFENSSRHSAEFIGGLVCEFVNQTCTLDPPLDDTVKFLDAQRVRWTSPTVIDEAIIPLLQFDSDALPIQLTDGTEIAVFMPSEKAEIWEPLNAGFGSLTVDELRSSRGKLVKRTERPRTTHPFPTDNLTTVTWCAITALRLLKPGPVGARLHHQREVGPVLHPSASMSSLTEFLLPEHSFGTYRLLQTDVDGFTRLYQLLYGQFGVARFASMVFCLRRFNLSYTRDHLDDRIIDLVIALEGTLLFGAFQELRNRLSLRGATLLRRQRPPHAVYRDLRDLYDVRSKIVHSGKALEELATDGDIRMGRGPSGLEGYVREVEQLVREVLLAYVERVASGTGVAAVNEMLDRELLTGLGAPGVSNREHS